MQKKSNSNPIDFPKLLVKNDDPSSMYPVLYVSTGSNVYGLSNKFNNEYAGIHLMSTMNYLQHPEFRCGSDISRLSYDCRNSLVSEDHPSKSFSITSFEISKFISLYTKSSIVVYDILYLSPVFTNPEMIAIINKLKEGITNKIGISAKTYVMNNWQKDKTDQRKIIMSYYRLLQAIVFLREEQYVSDAFSLWEEFPKFNKFKHGKEIFEKFRDSNYIKTKLSENEITGSAKELEELIDEVNKASIATRLPDTTPKPLISSILELVVNKRLNAIYKE